MRCHKGRLQINKHHQQTLFHYNIDLTKPIEHVGPRIKQPYPPRATLLPIINMYVDSSSSKCGRWIWGFLRVKDLRENEKIVLENLFACFQNHVTVGQKQQPNFEKQRWRRFEIGIAYRKQGWGGCGVASAHTSQRGKNSLAILLDQYCVYVVVCHKTLCNRHMLAEFLQLMWTNR